MTKLISQLIALMIVGITLTRNVNADPLADAQSAYSSGDYAAALELFSPLAKDGVAKAQLSLGVMYYIGQGVTQSYKDAAKWFQLSAKQGNALAQNILGEMYDHGTGVTQSYAEAAKWYRLAAEQGDKNGQYNLGLMYSRELGLPLDNVLAYMWMSMSAKAADELALLAKQMTPEQVAKAQELAAQCTANRFQNCTSTTFIKINTGL